MRGLKTKLLIIVLFIFGMLEICNGQSIHSKVTWTSKNPFSIPLRIRKVWYNKGNLVPNSSFEHVNCSQNNEGDHNTKLNDWEIIGSDVQVTDIQKLKYKKKDAFQGNHALKIVRTNDNIKSNSQSAGMLSDFIRVIPGKYSFTFYIRLKKIVPPFDPYTGYDEKVKKGIDIRIIYFDRDKKKIGQRFKAFSFYNFYRIHDFKWGLTIGESHWPHWSGNPFSSGYIPENCQYIKVFFGLKDQGTMWVDKINYHLSKWNFTSLERMHSFFTKKYDLTELLIPTPQVVKNKVHLSLENKNVLLTYEEKETPEIRKALSLLRKQFTKISDISVSVNKYTSASQLPNAGLKVILVSKQFPLADKFINAFQKIDNKEQGYFIRRKADAIYVGANTGIGLYYGACTLSQLIDYKQSILDYADITDWPDFKGRTAKLMNYKQNWLMKDHLKEVKRQLNEIDFYAFYKISTFYNSYGTFNSKWWNIGNFYKQFYKKVGQKIAQYGDILSLAIQINPHLHVGQVPVSTISDSVQRMFSYGTKKGFKKVKEALSPALNAGATTVMFCADDYVPHIDSISTRSTLWTRADKAKFINLAEAQAYVLNKLKSWLNANYENVRLEFVPTKYRTSTHILPPRAWGRSYLHDLDRKVNSSIPFIWTGRITRSLKYDMADIRLAYKLYRRKPMIWDNSVYARNVKAHSGQYPKRAISVNIFMPFDIEYPENFSSYFDSQYYNNNGGFKEIDKISSITFADFTWNTKDYNPEFSLFKTLIQMFGRKNTKHLLQFNDAYYRLVSISEQLRMKLKYDSNYQLGKNGLRRKANKEINRLHKYFDKLIISDNKLNQELKKKMDKQISNWQKLNK